MSTDAKEKYLGASSRMSPVKAKEICANMPNSELRRRIITALEQKAIDLRLLAGGLSNAERSQQMRDDADRYEAIAVTL